MADETETIRVYESAKSRLEDRGSMGDTFPEVVDDLLDERDALEDERDELEERVADLEAQLTDQGSKEENANA